MDAGGTHHKDADIIVTIDPKRDKLPYGGPKSGATGNVMYVVAFERDADAEMCEEANVETPEDIALLRGVKQLVDELQEGFDRSGIAGHFQVIARVSEGHGVEIVQDAVEREKTERESPRIFALVSSQGTACGETAITSVEDTPQLRERIEAAASRDRSADRPLPERGWHDVTDNDFLRKSFGLDPKENA